MKKLSSKNLLTMSKAARYLQNYKSFSDNPGQLPFTPVESYQFSIEAIEHYIQYVKGLACLKGIEVTGLRVVNAVYPSSEEYAEDRDQQTVLFIPTYKNDKGEDEAFDPLYVENGVPVKLNKLLKEATEPESPEIKGRRKVLFSLEESHTESSFLNFGKMGKPPVLGDD